MIIGFAACEISIKQLGVCQMFFYTPLILPLCHLLYSSLFTLRSSLFVLHLIPPLSLLSNCPALPCSPKSFISNRWRVFEMSELEKPVRLTISPGLKASNTRMQMRYSLLLNVYSPMSLSHKNLFVYRNSSSMSFLSYLFLSFPPINLFCSRSKFSKK